jgi:Tol biopolymer transport system component
MAGLACFDGPRGTPAGDGADALSGSEYEPTFSPDGRQVAFVWDGEQQDNFDIYVTLVGSTEVRRLTADAAVGFAPQWSPDGNWMLHLDTMLAPVGSPQRLTATPFWGIEGLAWSRDGGSLVFGARQGAVFHLWRVAAAGNQPPVRIEIAGVDATQPATATSADRLAFSKSTDDQDISRLDVGGAAYPIARSSARESGMQFSPDGRRIAFCSGRSGDAFEVWVSGADGRSRSA